MNSPTLSVLMPNYNHSKYIGEALTAILSQSYKPLEIIVVDDASTDTSVEIIRQFVDVYPVVRPQINEKNEGVVHNLNKLLELARGDYVFFAAADDKILPGFLEKSMELLIQYPQAGLCSTMSMIIDEEGRKMGLDPSVFIISKEECFVTPERVLSTLKKISGSWMAGNATVWKRSALMDSGSFIPELHAFCDGFIWQVVALKYGVCFIPEVLACWRKMDSGYASSMSIDETKEIMHNAVKLMRTDYQDLFPEEYMDDFKRSQLFFANLNLFSSIQREKLAIMNHLLRPKPIMKSLIFFAKAILQKLERISFMLYLLIRFRPRLLPIIIRKMNKYHYSKYYAKD